MEELEALKMAEEVALAEAEAAANEIAQGIDGMFDNSLNKSSASESGKGSSNASAGTTSTLKVDTSNTNSATSTSKSPTTIPEDENRLASATTQVSSYSHV